MSDETVPPPVSEPAAAPVAAPVAEEAAGGVAAESQQPEAPPAPPPGFEDVAPGTHAVPPAELDALASAVQAARVTPGAHPQPPPPFLPPPPLTRAHALPRFAAEQADVDAPDLSLKSGVLLEEEVTEIKTVLAADATPYTSAKTFEDLNLSPELLKVRCATLRAGACTAHACVGRLESNPNYVPYWVLSRRASTRKWASANPPRCKRRRCP
jgi:hypothetical protein